MAEGLPEGFTLMFDIELESLKSFLRVGILSTFAERLGINREPPVVFRRYSHPSPRSFSYPLVKGLDPVFVAWFVTMMITHSFSPWYALLTF